MQNTTKVNPNEIRDKWNDIIASLGREEDSGISKVLFNTFFKHLKYDSFDYDNNTVNLTVDYNTCGECITILNNRKDIISSFIFSHTGYIVKIDIHYSNDNNSDESVSSYNKDNFYEKYPFLSQGHSFDNFVQTDVNSIAYTVSIAVAENPDGKTYNPLFIYSKPGLGKTHLMHSIVRYILENHPETKVKYVTSEEFINDVVNSLRPSNSSNNISSKNSLKDKYRKVDVLLIDDIQFIIGKDSSQREFFNTFEALYQTGKQLVISSDRPPSQMEELDSRYRSRFTLGSPIDIQPPDYETSMAILKNKRDEKNLKIDDSILEYIATNINKNVRDLEGALNRLDMVIKFKKIEDLTIEIAAKELRDYISPNSKIDITPEYIINIVAEHFKIDKALIISDKRTKDLTLPRHICMYLCNEYTNLTQTDIAKCLNRKNHTTVINAINKIKQDINVEKDTADAVNTIKKKINSQ